MTLRFRTLRPWLLETFGRPMHRVALDAGSTCPNRDGTKGRGGCVYCDVEGSGTGALKTGLELEGQLRVGMERVQRRETDGGVIAYFQSYSNTYVSPERLDEVLSVVEPFLGQEIQAVALATRPDTLPTWALDRLERMARRVPVWLELGLESADDRVLDAIGRFHTLAEFQAAAQAITERGLDLIAHAILGLPGDGREGAQRTAEAIAASGAAGVKVHHLMVLRRTVLEGWWRKGDVELLDPETYTEWLADFVERLHPDQVLHRLTGDGPEEKQLAPCWTVHKNEIRSGLQECLEQRGTRQGSLFSEQATARTGDAGISAVRGPIG